MGEGTRAARVGEEIRQEISLILLREVRDPGIGFVTLTRVKASPDLLVARVFYTQIGDAAARVATAKALGRAIPFLRRQIGRRLRLRRVPELIFQFDESIENQARIEKILIDLEDERGQRAQGTGHRDEATGQTAEGAETPAPDKEPE